jgi:hypothetical protein
MNSHTLENWIKIKKALEDSNKTDCFLYRKACSAIKTGYDPLEPKLKT